MSRGKAFSHPNRYEWDIGSHQIANQLEEKPKHYLAIARLEKQLGR